jgi:hypothetical protein
MSDDPGYSKSTDSIDANARDALRRLKSDHTYEDWRSVGKKLMIITEAVMREHHVTAWDQNDRKLVSEVSKRFENWENSVSNAKPLTKQERWALRELMTNSDIHIYYMTLTGPERRRLNHPNAIINRWKNDHPDKVRRVPHRNPINLEVAIDTVCAGLEAMDSDNRRAVLERLTSPFKNELLTIVQKFRKTPTKTKRSKASKQRKSVNHKTAKAR